MLLGGVITLVVGLLLAAVALVQALRARSRLQLLVATPTLPVAQTAHGRMVEVQGTVVPSEQGVLVSPSSGRQVVLYHVSVYDTGGSVSLVHLAKDRREFWLQDEFGDYARVLPDRSQLVAGGTRYTPEHAGAEFVQDKVKYARMSPELYAWAAAVSGCRDRPLMVEAREIAPGDRLFALGFAERNADGTLFLRDRGERELLLSDHTESELREHRRHQGKLGCIFLVVSLGVAAIGAALTIAGWYFDI